MNKIPFLAWFLQGIPESIALVFLAVSFMRTEINYRKIIHFGVLHAIGVYLLRLLPLSMGVHTILLIVILSSWTYLITNKDYHKCIFSSVVSFVMLIIFETVVMQFTFSYFHLTVEQVLQNSWIRTIIGYPQVILILVSGIIIKKFRGRNA